MNKCCAKMVKKTTLLSLIMAIVVAVSIVITAIFGVQFASTVGDNQTLTVTVNRYFYDNGMEKIENECNAKFQKFGLSVKYAYKGEMSGDECEIVYVFDANANLASAKDELKSAFAEKTKDGGEWDGAFLEVATAKETVQTKIPVAYTVRASIAVAVFAVLAFVYVALRYRLYMGVTTALSVLLTAIESTALVLLLRIPVTTSVFYAVAVASMLASVFTLLTMHKIRANKEEISTEEKVVSSIACKEIVATTATLGVALVLVGAVATWAVRWFALCALVALLVAFSIGVFVSPAIYLSLQKRADSKSVNRTKSGYVGAVAENKAEGKTEENTEEQSEK